MTHHTTAGATTAGSAAIAPGHHGDVRPPGLLARSIAEGVGSFLVILAGLGATMLATETSLAPVLVFGIAVIAAMIAFGYVSGGHFNPAITIGSAVAGRTGWISVAPYVVAQVLGAVAASGLIWLVLSANPQLTGINTFFSAASNGFDEHSPTGFPLTSVFLVEVIATALLVGVFLGAGSRSARRDLAPFAVGLSYAGLLSFILPITNGGINPVRAAASAIFAEPWAIEQLWLFWVGPILGGLIAGLASRSIDSWGPVRPDSAPAADAPASPVLDRQHESPEDDDVRGRSDRPAGDAASFFDTPRADEDGTARDVGEDRSASDEDRGTSGPLR